MHREGKQTSNNIEDVAFWEGQLADNYTLSPFLYFLLPIFLHFFLPHLPLSFSFLSRLISTHTFANSSAEEGGGSFVQARHTIFLWFWEGEKQRAVCQSLSKLGERLFFCSSMLFVSVTTDGVIPFHSLVWLCPIMPACSVSACSPLGRQEGDCWARQSPFSH